MRSSSLTLPVAVAIYCLAWPLRSDGKNPPADPTPSPIPAASPGASVQPTPVPYPSMPVFDPLSAGSPAVRIPAFAVPPPQPEPPRAPSAPRRPLAFSSGLPDFKKIERAVPQVELWRVDATVPHKLKRNKKEGALRKKFEAVLVGGTDPTSLVLRFDRSLAGSLVEVTATRGVSVEPEAGLVRLPSTAEALLQVALGGEVGTGQITFSVENVFTVVPLVRVPESVLAEVEAARAGKKEGP